jgi:hypothetical protein
LRCGDVVKECHVDLRTRVAPRQTFSLFARPNASRTVEYRSDEVPTHTFHNAGLARIPLAVLRTDADR